MNKQTWLFRVAFAAALLVMAFAFSNTAAFAQGDTPAPASKVLVNEAAAKRLLMKGVLNADTARAIVDACVAWNKSIPNSLPAVIFVLSPTGEIIDAHTMDGALPIAYETGLLKAKTVLYARTSSEAVANRFNESNLSMPQRVSDLGKDYGLDYFWVGGGLPVMVDGEMVAAVGVGGGTQDEMCAYQAIVKVVGPQPPLVPPAGRGGAGPGGPGGPGGGAGPR